MRGRLLGVAVSNASVVVAEKDPNRTSIVFSVGDTTNASSCIIRDHSAATVSNGFPLSFASGPLRLEGEIATHQFNAIRLAAVDCVVGVIQGFPDGTADVIEAGEPISGVPTL